MPRLNSRGVAHILLLVILLGGIAAGVYLVQKTQIFKPKASSKDIIWLNAGSAEQDNCVTSDKEGKPITTCPKVKFQVNTPKEVSQ